ncbi:MAG: ABC transporter ATP-binding protein [Flavobacteriales bacterium]|nr:ABC transporter ATP-binding protein [Flavobacteriales bacterium]
MSSTLEIQEVCKSFTKGTEVLSSASLTLRENEIGVLIGPSGSGKSTLLRSIAGLEIPDSGSISIAGKCVNDARTYLEPSDRQVGFLFQDFALFPHLTVEQNIRFGLHGVDKRVASDRVQKYMQLCSISELKSRYPHQISGGQQQRVALARALATEPVMLLLDEPFSNVDESLKAQIRTDMVELIRASKTTALIVVHDIEDAYAIADKISVLIEGRVAQSASPEELYSSPASSGVASVTGEVNLLSAKASSFGFTCAIGELDQPHDLEAGQGATLVIRPEDLNLEKEGDWTVEEMRYSGIGYLVKCINNLERVSVFVSAAELPAVNDRVGFKVHRMHWIVND